MTLRSTQPQGKGGRFLGMTTLALSCADCHELWESQPAGSLRVCPGLHSNCFTFTFTLHKPCFV